MTFATLSGAALWSLLATAAWRDLVPSWACRHDEETQWEVSLLILVGSLIGVGACLYSLWRAWQ